MSHEPKPGYNRKPVCPHCGTEYRSVSDLEKGDDVTETVECQRCLAEYEVICHVQITYSTQPV